jgi:hypothetical protein
MKLGVGYPWSSPFMFTDFTETMLNLKHPEGFEVRFFRGDGWCPARRHIKFCEKALNWGADLICIVGADQVHPEDMLCRLVERFKQGYEVITAMVPCRGFIHWQEMQPFQPMMWRFKTNDETGKNDFKIRPYRGMELDSDMLHVIDPKDGEIQPVNFAGSGVTLFHRDHLLAIKRPWFKETIIYKDFQRIASMDVTFIWRLQTEANAKVWVDTTIKVKHSHIFQIDETYQQRFEDWSRPGAGPQEICPVKVEHAKNN